MDSVGELYEQVRSRFPEIAAGADSEHTRLGFDVDPEFAHLWFESLAKVLNLDMARGIPFETHEPLIAFLAEALTSGDEEVHGCIDSSFVENLFWRVPSAAQIRAYWQAMPTSLQELYIAFHGREP